MCSLCTLSFSSVLCCSFWFFLLQYLPLFPFFAFSLISVFAVALVPALQTRLVYRQRTGRLTCGGGVGRLESFWYLLPDMWRGHQDRCARMQPTHVSSPGLWSHACQVDLVSIFAIKANVP